MKKLEILKISKQGAEIELQPQLAAGAAMAAQQTHNMHSSISKQKLVNTVTFRYVHFTPVNTRAYTLFL